MKKNCLAKFLPACVALVLGPSTLSIRANVTPVCKSPSVSYFGGPVIANVEVVPVFYGPLVNSQLVANMPQFFADVTVSTYWSWLCE